MAIKRITTNLIKDSDIATVDIANNAITAAKITDGNITTAKLADLSVTAGKLAGTLDLTGKTITVATATTGDNDTSPASTAFVQQEIAALVDSSPDSLNTLNELAAALGDDASFSTTITNSIATKAPLASPTLTGTVTVDTDANSKFTISDGGTDAINLLGGSGDELYIGANAAYKLRFRTNGNIVMDNGGNLGIGTDSPDFTLDVEADKDTWISRIYNTGSDANAQTLLVRSDATAAHDATVMGVYADSGYKMVVKSTGNVGIGTSSPNSPLEIVKNITFTNSDTFPQLLIKTTATTTGNQLGLGVDETDNVAFIEAIDRGNNVIPLVLQRNAGRVGIGVDNPSTILQVGDGTTTEYITIDKSTTGESGILFKNAGNNKGKILLDSNENLQFYVNNTTNAMTILESGNVGINETSPDYKLHISGIGSSAQMQIESTSNSNAQLIFRNTSSAGSGATGGFHIGLLGDTSGDGLIYHHHDKPIRFYTNAANTMTLTGEDGMLHLNGRSGAYGYAVPQDEALGYTNNLNAGAFGILHRGAYDSYVTGNTYYYKTGGSSSWRAKYGAYKSTVMGMINGAFGFDTSTTAPGSNGAATIGLARRVTIDSDGLKFGSDTAAANALDDYEEGTFSLTPNTGTLSTQSCKYSKVGGIVTFIVDFTVGTGGATTYTGLPFAPNLTTAWVPYVVGQTFASGRTYPTMVVGATGTTIIMRDCGSGQALNSMAVTAGATYHTCFSYTTDA